MTDWSTEWFSASMMPALLLILGGLVLPLFKGIAQKVYSLLVPVLVIFFMTQIKTGTFGEIDFAGISLVMFKVDKLSMVFGWVFAIMSLIGNLYSLHIVQTGERVAAFLYMGSAFMVVFAGDWFTLLVGWEIMAFASAYLIFFRWLAQ